MAKSMIQKSLTTLLMIVTASSSVFISPVSAKPSKGKIKPIVVVKKAFMPVRKAPVRRSYHHKKIPNGIAVVVIAGITYAIIDGLYYRRDHDQYIYVEQPPVASPEEISVTETETTAKVEKGTLVDVLPEAATTVTINGATFYVDGEIWYTPIAGTSKFVIVEPQL